jgi:hypothetical protein
MNFRRESLSVFCVLTESLLFEGQVISVKRQYRGVAVFPEMFLETQEICLLHRFESLGRSSLISITYQT